jgi:hypothetical protein
VEGARCAHAQPARERSRGPLERADVAGVDDPVRTVDPAGRVESAQQFAPQALPHAGGPPVTHQPRGGPARAADLLGHHPPRDPVSSTKTIAVNAARSPTRGRPVRHGDCSPRSQPPLAHCPPGATIPQRSVAIGRKRGPLSQSLWEGARWDAGSTPPPWTIRESTDPAGIDYRSRWGKQASSVGPRALPHSSKARVLARLPGAPFEEPKRVADHA